MAWDPHRPPHKAQPSTNSTPFARKPPFSFPITSHYLFASTTSHHHTTPCDPIARITSQGLPPRAPRRSRGRDTTYHHVACRVPTVCRAQCTVCVCTSQCRTPEQKNDVPTSIARPGPFPLAPRVAAASATNRMVRCSVPSCVARVFTVCDRASQNATP